MNSEPSPTSKATLENPGDWLTPGRFAALLGLLIAACFPQVWLGLEGFAYLDSGQFAYPVACYHREAFWRGEIPLWNPLNSCGIPFLAQWNTLTLYPLSLFYLLLPLPWSFGVFCLGHLFLGGMGMYFLAFRWTGNRLGAAVAGAVFAFNGFSWYALMWPHFLAGLAWMPWVVLAMERGWREGRRATLLAGVAGALQLLSGGAEVILQTWVLLGVLWAVLLCQRTMPLKALVLRAIGSGALAAGLAAAQLLPFVDLLSQSQRGAGYGGGGMASIAAMPLTGWLNYLVPLFRALPNLNGVYVQAGQSWTGSYYLGIATVLLALVALWHVRHQRVGVLAGLALFGLVMAWGEPGVLYGWVRRLLPIFGFVRFPVKFVVLPTFALPLLAAMGVNWLLGLPAATWAREWRRTRLLALALAIPVALALWLTWSAPIPGNSPAATTLNAAVRAGFLALTLACIACLRAAVDLRLHRLAQIGLLVVLWFDVFTHSSNLSPTVPVTALQPNAVRELSQWDETLAPGGARVMQSKAAFQRMLSTGSANLETDLGGRRLTQFLNLNLLDHAPKLDGFYSLDVQPFLEVFKHLYFTTNEAEPLKDFLGVAQTSNPTNLLAWAPRTSFLPLVTGGQSPTFPNTDEEALRLIMADGFDPRHRVYLPPEARPTASAIGPSQVRLGQVRFSAQRITFEAEASAPAMLVVAQTYARGWRAYVDGRPAPLWRANYAFQALAVPAGPHRVLLAYEDRAFRMGAALSGLALLACAVAALWWRKP